MTYSSFFKAYFKKIFAASKASLVFIKDRCRTSRSQMFFKIVVLKNFAIFTGKHLKACNFIKKRLQYKCFPVNIGKFLRATFFNRTPPVAASADVLFYIIFSKRRCWIYCSCTLHNCFILKPKITLICFHSLSFVVPLARCHLLYHSLSLVVIRCHSLSLVVTRCTTRCHSLSFVVALVFIYCHSLSLVVPLLVTRCHSMYHSSVFL